MSSKKLVLLFQRVFELAEVINFTNYFCCNLHVSFYYYAMHSVWFGDCRIDICLLYLSMVLYCPHFFFFVLCFSDKFHVLLHDRIKGPMK